jgi:hypothetical protein
MLPYLDWLDVAKRGIPGFLMEEECCSSYACFQNPVIVQMKYNKVMRADEDIDTLQGLYDLIKKAIKEERTIK